jgi:hypothetical protein
MFFRTFPHTTAEVIFMNQSLEHAAAFGAMLRENPQAAHFYDHCTQEQRNAILLQVHMLNSPDKLKAFVDNLPSAAL